MVKELENRIREALKNVKPWQRVPTTVNGVYLIKTPSDVIKEMIMVEINPLNERGTPMKRRGLFLKDTIEFGGFKDIFENDRVMYLLGIIEELDGKEKYKEVKEIEL
jgi:hypothetical protein